MATATAFVGSVLPETNTHFEQVISSSASRIITSNGPDSWRTVYYGDFTISPSGEISGSITRVVKFFDDVKHYELAGLQANAATVFTAILEDFNESAAATHMLRLADVMDGSGFGDVIHAYAGNDTVRGNGGLDQIFGGSGHDRVLGGGGTDNLRGDEGNDSIYGGIGSDALDAGDGRDWLIGGGGNDLLWGGAGRDTFAFARGDGTDEIVGFEDGADLIEIRSGAEEFNDLIITGSTIRFANVEIVLSFFDGTLGAEDFRFV